LRRRAQVSQQSRPRAQKEPHQAPAALRTTPNAVSTERVYEADELGAVLLEGADLRAYWERVTACRHLLLWKRSRQQAGRAPCR
jgi:hypothetical protein